MAVTGGRLVPGETRVREARRGRRACPDCPASLDPMDEK